MYLERVTVLGARFEDFAPHSGYFWRHEPTFDAAPAGPAAFLAAMGLTLEQANLDFAARQRDAFRQAGDPESADVLATVQADEVRHVAFAARWLRELAPGDDDVARYRGAVPFPFSAARAKGRPFDTEARRAAGLEPDFVEYVRAARGTADRGDAP